MASIYEKITTPKELLQEVRMHGFSTKTEDICRAQDIFGHAANEDLVALATDNGMNGSWSTGKEGYSKEFYSVIFNIWSHEDAARFWMQNTSPEYKELLNLRKTCKELSEQCDKQDKLLKAEHKRRLEETSARLDAEKKAERLDTDVYDRDMTIMELKAKLYDLMTKEAKK